MSHHGYKDSQAVRGAGSARTAGARLMILLLAGATLSGCGDDKPTSYVDRVWRVSESSTVQTGTLYTLLSEGTLVIASRANRPALGTWTANGNGGLTMIEDGQPYQIETLELTASRWRIRHHNPGEPVDMTLVPAQP
ncbi:hypothetical protein [Pseudomonas sp. Marseille-QA0892]